jgi:hypothetical protein
MNPFGSPIVICFLKILHDLPPNASLPEEDLPEQGSVYTTHAPEDIC